MKKFNDVEKLVEYMLNHSVDTSVRVVADKNICEELLEEIFLWKDTKPYTCIIYPKEYYDKEYAFTVFYNQDDDVYNFSIEPAFSEKKCGVYDYVLFHENVNSKVQIDMENNENVFMNEYDWFTLGEDDEDDESDEEDTKIVENEDNDNQYFVNGEQVTKEEYTKAYDSMQEVCRKSVLEYCELMDEMNEWRKLLHW